jgi:hypothetical protein
MEENSRYLEIAMSIRSTFVRIGAGVMLALIGAQASFAQRMEPLAASAHASATDATRRQSAESQVTNRHLVTWGGVGGGVIGGSAGLVGGFVAGATWGNIGACSGEDCGLGSAILAAAVGEAIGLAIGTHVGSSGRGKLAIAMLTSTVIGAAGVYVAVNAEGSAPVILAAVPVVQLLAVLALER